MNIFYLDENPRTCAMYHTDKHVVKMILESAQILCTALNVKANSQIAPYRSTHINHPCVKWAMKSINNWLFIYNLLCSLEQEWQYRYNHSKAHKSVKLLYNWVIWDNSLEDLAYIYLSREVFTPPPLCMPEHCIIQNNPVESYRNYYNLEKRHLHKWTNREIPFFITK